MTEIFSVGDFVVPLHHKDVNVELPEEYDLSYAYGATCGQVGRVIRILKKDEHCEGTPIYDQVVMICHYFISEPDKMLTGEQAQFGSFASWQVPLPSFCLRRATEKEIQLFKETQIFENSQQYTDFSCKEHQQNLKLSQAKSAVPPAVY